MLIRLAGVVVVVVKSGRVSGPRSTSAVNAYVYATDTQTHTHHLEAVILICRRVFAHERSERKQDAHERGEQRETDSTGVWVGGGLKQK